MLQKRQDISEVAALLLDFWPTAVGDWAVTAIPANEILPWVLQEGADELLAVRSLAAVSRVQGIGRFSAPFLTGIVRSTLRMANFAQHCVRELENRKRSRTHGLPKRINVKSEDFAVTILPAITIQRISTSSNAIVDARRYFSSETARHFSCLSTSQLSIYFSCDDAIYYLSSLRGDIPNEFAEIAPSFASQFTGSFATDSAQKFARAFSRYLASHLTVLMASNFLPRTEFFLAGFLRFFSRKFILKLTTEITDFFERDFYSEITLRGVDNYDSSVRLAFDFTFNFRNKTSLQMEPPFSNHQSRDLSLRREAASSEDREFWIFYARSALARISVEAWAALVTSVGRQIEERRAYLHRRIENAWLLHVWPGVDKSMPTNPTPDQLALYLTLGWTQVTITWQWPATERWIGFFTTDPPSHWLPRSQWHLCWLLHNPDDPHHNQALDAALEEGLADEERPGIAEEFRKLFPPLNAKIGTAIYCCGQ